MSIRWDQRPPGAAAQRLPIPIWRVNRHVNKNRPAFVRLLGPWDAVWLHWVKGNGLESMPCRNGDEKCPYCPDRSFLYGYAPALLWRGDSGNNQEGWAPVVCGLPDRIMCGLEGQDVRGLLVAFWWEGANDKGWVGWRIEEEKVKYQPPPAFPVRPILEAQWQRRRRQFELDAASRNEPWLKDLNDLVADHDAGPAPAELPRIARPPVAVPPPPALTAPVAMRETFAQVEARLKAEQQHAEAARARRDVLPMPPAVPEVPKAAKKPRRGRKGGA